jgi:hypothetical protein
LRRKIYGVSVEIGLGTMIYIPSFIKIGSAIQKLIGGDTQTHRQHEDVYAYLSYFEEMKEGLCDLLSSFKWLNESL